MAKVNTIKYQIELTRNEAIALLSYIQRTEGTILEDLYKQLLEEIQNG